MCVYVYVCVRIYIYIYVCVCVSPLHTYRSAGTPTASYLIHMSNNLNSRIHVRAFSALVPQNSVGGLLCICGLHSPLFYWPLDVGGEAFTAEKFRLHMYAMTHSEQFPNTIERHVNNTLRNL